MNKVVKPNAKSAGKSGTGKSLSLGTVVMIALLIAGAVGFWFQNRTVPPAENDTGKIQWITDLDKGLSMAREAGLPVMLFFTADWCGYCKKLIQSAFSDEAVARAASRIIPIFVDIDKYTEVQEIYKLRGIPTVIFLNSDGQTVETLVGGRDSATYIDIIDELIQDRS